MRARSRLTPVTGRPERSRLDLVQPARTANRDVTTHDPMSGASQRVLYFATPGDEVAVALSDLASSPKLVVEMAIDRDDLERRLARPGLNGLSAAAVVVAGEYAVDTILEAAPAMLTRHEELVLVIFTDLRTADFEIPGLSRLVLVDVSAPPADRRRTLWHALGRAQPAQPIMAATAPSRSVVGAITGAVRRPHSRAPSKSGEFAAIAPTGSQSRPISRDPLTGLADRAALHQRLESEIARLRADPGYQFALLILNVNRFKVINDNFGHDQADALLIDVGQRLGDAVRTSDLVARMGADEFAIVLGQSQGHLNAQIVAQRLFRGPITLTSSDGRSLAVTASVGGVIASGGTQHTVADLYRKASLALANVKERGGTRVAFFHPESHARDLFQLDLEPQIMRGIRQQEFSLHFQPVVALGDGRIEGVEALLRWQHPTLGLVSPASFVPMLESSGLIEPLGRWIVARACTDLLSIQDAPGGRDIFLNLNVSHRQLRQADFAQVVADEVARGGVDPAKLGIELTETTMIDDFETVTANINALRETGIKIFVDDFGVGYSSLASLSRLPVDVLKIDRSFIREMTSHKRSASLVAKIVEIGHIFDLPIVAEGIETPAELDAVRSVGCDFAQGYFLGRPLPLDELKAHLSVRR